MGYRSDVALVLSRKGTEKLNATLNDSKISDNTRSSLSRLLDNADDKHEDISTGAKIWYWEWIKWYPEYSDISILEELMSELADEEFRFIRIGEEMTDIEENGSYYNNPFGLDLTIGIVYNDTQTNEG